MEKYGIIGAMESEVRQLCDGLTNKEIVEYAGLSFSTGLLSGKDVVIVKSGIGKVNAALCAQALILKFGVTKVINTGIAGAFAKVLAFLILLFLPLPFITILTQQLLVIKKARFQGCLKFMKLTQNLPTRQLPLLNRLNFQKIIKL